MIDNGVIDGMKDGIANTAYGGSQQQHGVAAGRGDKHARQHKAGQPETQHRGRANAVDHKARRGLAKAGHQEKTRGKQRSEESQDRKEGVRTSKSGWSPDT